MSITIVKTRSIGRNRYCRACGNVIHVGTLGVLDIQDNTHKRYYHPNCFPREKAEEIWEFWNEIHMRNQER